MDVLPLFKSHYSLGRSILTLRTEGESSPQHPDSIIDIAKENELEKVFLIDDNMSGFLEAYSNCKDSKLNLIFGLRLSICADMHQKDEEAKKQTCKYLIIAKNTDGYKRLIKIYSLAAKDGFYYYPRIDFKALQEFWNKKDLELAIPFYDSFIFNNVMGSASCVPDFSNIEPTFLVENNNLPFDPLIKKRVEQYCGDKYKTVNAQSIFYKKKKDFKAYLTFKCINNRSALSKPNLDHMSSDEFCVESWREKNGTF